ncbi:Ubiquitin carboxyl-terminal hydrolase 16 [Amphibalanus amphitrite]|uniref:Ubiquitin carboxyl-terminal hydrolase n=1 Tax=Amphibalanus amphitrite TaxID=1232801 RepID=A0A6A4WM41_AMPAM|nr:Ubiquitin carboxyl-terminal hydrolase 16 [Amphibalanus amphitrite]
MESQPDEASSQTLPPTCSKCHQANKKKRHKTCDVCKHAWHLGCVRLSRAQAAALNRWVCPTCLSSGRRSFQQCPDNIQGDGKSKAIELQPPFKSQHPEGQPTEQSTPPQEPSSSALLTQKGDDVCLLDSCTANRIATLQAQQPSPSLLKRQITPSSNHECTDYKMPQNGVGRGTSDNDSLPKVKGLINLGNSCYLNSVLQCLSQCHYLTHYLDINSRSGRKAAVSADGETMELVLPEAGPITKSLFGFLEQMHTTRTGSTVSPSNLLKNIALKVPQFASCDQQDAHELLRELMQQTRLEDLQRRQSQILLGLGLSANSDSIEIPDHLKARAETLSRQVSHTTIDTIFSGQLVSAVVCQACTERTYHLESFLDLSLPVVDYKPSRPRKQCVTGACDEDSSDHILVPCRASDQSRRTETVPNGMTRAPNESVPAEGAASGQGDDPTPTTGASDELDRPPPLNRCGWLSRALTTLAPHYQAAAGECSLLTCLKQYTAPELLDGNNKFGCDNCTELRNKRLTAAEPASEKFGTMYSNATKQLLIYSPPPVLTIHLKRFEMSGSSLRKVNRHVQFCERFDLAPFCSSISQDLPQMRDGQRQVLYSLFGVVEHSGRLTSGHYTAYVRVRRRHSQLTVNPALLTTLVTDAFALACERAGQCATQIQPEATYGSSPARASQPEADELKPDMEPEAGRWFHVSDTQRE